MVFMPFMLLVLFSTPPSCYSATPRLVPRVLVLLPRRTGILLVVFCFKAPTAPLEPIVIILLVVFSPNFPPRTPAFFFVLLVCSSLLLACLTTPLLLLSASECDHRSSVVHVHVHVATHAWVFVDINLIDIHMLYTTPIRNT